MCLDQNWDQLGSAGSTFNNSCLGTRIICVCAWIRTWIGLDRLAPLLRVYVLWGVWPQDFEPSTFKLCFNVVKSYEFLITNVIFIPIRSESDRIGLVHDICIGVTIQVFFRNEADFGWNRKES